MDVKAIATKTDHRHTDLCRTDVFVPFAAVAAEFAIPTTIAAPQSAVLPETGPSPTPMPTAVACGDLQLDPDRVMPRAA